MRSTHSTWTTITPEKPKPHRPRPRIPNLSFRRHGWKREEAPIHKAPHQIAVARRLRGHRGRRPRHRKGDPVKSPLTDDVCRPAIPVCTVTIVVCNVTHGVCDLTSVVCTLAASVCNVTNASGGLADVVCTVTQAFGRFAYGHCGPANSICNLADSVCKPANSVCNFANSVCKPANSVCGPVSPLFYPHFLTCRPHVVVLPARPPVGDSYRDVWPANRVGTLIHISQGGILCLGSLDPNPTSLHWPWWSRLRGNLHRYAIVNETDLRDGLARVVAEPEESAVKGQIRHAQTARWPGMPGKMGGLVMEARGIEPRSEPRSKIASTCVGYALMSPAAGT